MATEVTQNIWRFIRLDQYSRPPEPPRETMREGIFGLWDRLKWGRKSEPSVFEEKKLSRMPQELLDKAAPTPDWAEAVEAVSEVLENWLRADHPESAAQIFVGRPYGGIGPILEGWAQTQGWKLVAEPTPGQILAGGQEWLGQLDDSGDPLVLPRLERFYLRHYDGLTLLRRLLDRIFSHDRRWLVGCDSWAWGYLTKALRIDAVLPPPFTLAAFDQDYLTVWFQRLAEKSGGREFSFRQADNGKYVLPPKAEAAGSGSQEPAPSPGMSDYLKSVAAYSLGIPGVAWAIWRSSLLFAETEAEHEEHEEEKRQKPGNQPEIFVPQEHPVWVRPWSQLPRPSVPPQGSHPQILMVLHALLLQGGLGGWVLAELLPLSPMEVMEILYLLEVAELLESEGGFWRVTARGYPVVRQALQSEGYLVNGA